MLPTICPSTTQRWPLTPRSRTLVRVRCGHQVAWLRGSATAAATWAGGASMNASSAMSTRPVRARPVMGPWWDMPLGRTSAASRPHRATGRYGSDRGACSSQGGRVKDIAVPPLVPVTTEGNLSDLPARNGLERPAHAAFARREGTGWVDVTNAQFLAEVRALAKGLVAAGVEVGDRVAIMSKTRYEWTLLDYAIWFAGAVTVPIYETSSAEQISWIVGDSDCVAVILETPTHARTLAGVRDGLPGLRDVWQIDTGGLDELATAGADTTDAELDERRARVRRGDIATIIYTSGTTGRPKGCELTHDNVFARFIEVLCVQSGARMGHTADLRNLLDDFSSYTPTFILAVPRVFEKIYNSAEQKATADGRGKIFAVAASTAIDWSRAWDDGRPGPLLRLRHGLFERLVYTRLRGAMGGKVQYAVSGGGPLGVRLGHFYRGIGLTVLEGYGLTETTAPATVNTPGQIKIGTVG